MIHQPCGTGPRAKGGRSMISRRGLLQGTLVGAVLTAMGGAPAHASDLREAPFSAGSGRLDVRVPGQAADCHIHILDPERFPFPNPTSTPPPKATVADYRLLQMRTGTKHTPTTGALLMQ